MTFAPVMTMEELLQWRNANGAKRIVATNGCFDLLHRGHVEHLAQAAAYGELLVVGLNSDDSVRALKGPTRPIQFEQDRAKILSALRCVGAVCIFSDMRATEFLRVLRPNVYVKGGDYSLGSMDKGERAVLEECGCLIVFLVRIGEFSTTGILNKQALPTS